MKKIYRIAFLLALIFLTSPLVVNAQNESIWAQFSNWLQSFSSNVRTEISPNQFQSVEMQELTVGGEPSASVQVGNATYPSATSGNGFFSGSNLPQNFENLNEGDEIDYVDLDAPDPGEPPPGTDTFPDLTKTFTIGGFTLKEIATGVGVLLLSLLMALAGIFSNFGHYELVEKPQGGYNTLATTMVHMEYRDFQLKDAMNIKENMMLGKNYAISSLKPTDYGTLTTIVPDDTDKWGRIKLTVPLSGVFYVAAEVGSVPPEWGQVELKQELFTAQSLGKPDKKFSLYKISSLPGSQISFKVTGGGPFLVSNNMERTGYLPTDRISLQTQNLDVDDILVDDVIDDALDITSVSEDFPGRYTRLEAANAFGFLRVTVPESKKVFIVATVQKAEELQSGFTLADQGEMMRTQDGKVFHLYNLTQRGGSAINAGDMFIFGVDIGGPFIASDLVEIKKSSVNCGKPDAACASQ